MSQLPADDITLRADESSLVLRVLERQVRIAVKLAPGSSSSAKRPPVDLKANSKVQLASQGAREAGHTLNANRRCASCGLHCVDCGKSVAYLEACLTMPCLGSTNSGADFKLQNFPKEDGEKYLFHGLQVHCSHVVATHFKLRVHFCTRCGH